ncbi:Hypothetical protein PHPALM_19896 [Phytophthora palmivora]|uniref:Uncharacterized protein n=1 Tax=Phytophthora palmivora TaxID=4796 RepID=A0A2P4XGA4_9STRA|nr:Hypothetical protein PHPALM_19896 [Phytophthora palmivora]
MVPRSWAELEKMHLRFQQEAHRRRADPASQYFLPFPVFQTIVAPQCPDNDKVQLLAMFELLDLKQTRKLAVMDFFSGLALLVDAKKPQKVEFVLSLLDNGGLKTLNKCELVMVVSAAARGLTMFAPGADVLQEATMRPMIRRLFGDSDEVLRQDVVNKALADPELLFFMSDLEAVSIWYLVSVISDIVSLDLYFYVCTGSSNIRGCRYSFIGSLLLRVHRE